MLINCELDEVIEIKGRILEKLGYRNDEQNQIHPLIDKIKLFSLKGGIELMNCDLMESMEGQEYLFYSMGEPFDY